MRTTPTMVCSMILVAGFGCAARPTPPANSPRATETPGETADLLAYPHSLIAGVTGGGVELISMEISNDSVDAVRAYYAAIKTFAIVGGSATHESPLRLRRAGRELRVAVYADNGVTMIEIATPIENVN